jgi:uncharacterized protein (DUF1778 family)
VRVNRRKPSEERKERALRIRLTQAHLDALRAAASKVGLGVSSWLLSVGLQAAASSAKGAQK